jgi:hypothetical protein
LWLLTIERQVKKIKYVFAVASALTSQERMFKVEANCISSIAKQLKSTKNLLTFKI